MRASVVFAGLLVVLGGVFARPAAAMVLDGGGTAAVDVTVACVPSDDPGLFGVQLLFPDGGASNIVAACGDRIPFTGLAAGTFTLTQFELAGTPWKLGDYEMSYGGDCAADGTISVSAGSTSSCTITRTRIAPLPPPPATLDVNVACVPSDDPGLFGVQLLFPDGGASNIQAACGDRIPFTGLAPGTYTLTQFELAGTPWKLGDYEMSYGGDCAADGTISVSAGSTSSCTITRTRKPDTTPPVTTDDAPQGWVNHDVVVQLSATDDRSGVQATYYRVDGGEEQEGSTVTIQASADHANDGVHTIDFYSVDNAGNVEPAHEALVEIDTTIPAVQYLGNSGTYTVDETVEIACTASDDLSGIASTTCADIDAPAYSFGLGTTTLSASAIDNAGNSGTGSTTFTVVLTSPGVDRLISRFFADASGAAGLIAQADAVASAPTGTAKSGAIRAFDNDAQARVGNQLTQAQADVLETLVAAL